MTTNAERVKRHKGRMKEAGFRRLDVWVSPELFTLIQQECKPWECYARTVERLLMGRRPSRRVTGK
ncbi:antitoxin MazE-like protein [Azoarcus sp. KH32C]|uniref:antitoxin MazE-like protein n=1 Tax=Azoarcus sp. KH32C TaxID=748247 RepID=UPI0002385FE5|nr:antitoxin MazE-like protein [Azoarcus sp. KH32C]BAL24015.1 hypothetical protein AZKH_1700 [Azoarcus sp. KH32C]